MSDIKMYHDLKEQAQKMAGVFAFHEMQTYQGCAYYEYDRDACEEGCTHQDINRLGKDFDAEKECWKCTKYYPTS